MVARTPIDLNVRGEIPSALQGSFVIACSRRHKDRSRFSRWQDSQADLIRLDIRPGRPGKVQARILTVDPTGQDFPHAPKPNLRGHYATQPNHGLNVRGDTLWATNLLFGSPCEVDLWKWTPRRVVTTLERTDESPRISSTAHFAWSLDRRYAYYHESLLSDSNPAAAQALRLVRLDTRNGTQRVWALEAPQGQAAVATNFHSAFYYEEGGKGYVGLLCTGAVIEGVSPHPTDADHTVIPSTRSTIWIIQLEEGVDRLAAKTLPELDDIDAISLSHLDVDASSRDGFVLYANYKEADVAEETHGKNIFGEQPAAVTEQYAGMTVEALNVGMVVRIERTRGQTRVRSFARGYDAGRTSLGHTWLPINIQLDESRQALFCSFSGFRPRLLPAHIARAYPRRATSTRSTQYVPPLLMRFDAGRLEPDVDRNNTHISYAEPIADCVVGTVGEGFACTFSPEAGLRIYRASDLSCMVAHATAHPIWQCGDTHFRPQPAHMVFVHR